MGKTKTDKRVNRIVKRINKELREDVFKDRFYLRQVEKARGECNLQYYLYEMRDQLEPERNYIIPWLWRRFRFSSRRFLWKNKWFYCKKWFLVNLS